MAYPAKGTVLGISGLAPATGAIDTWALNAGGSGYSVGNILTVTQGGASGGKFRVATVAAGVVTALELVAVGTGYAVANGLATTVSPSGGTGCTVNVTAVMTLVAELTNLPGFMAKRNTDDATNHDSPSGFQELIPTTIAGGEILLEGNFLFGTGQAQLITDQQAGAARSYKIVVPFPSLAAGVWTFTAFPSGFEPDAPYGSKLSFKGTLHITGQPTLA